MADSYDAILQAAQEYAKTRQNQSFSGLAGQAFNSLPQGNFDNPWMNIGISALKGLGSGYFGGLAQQNAQADYTDALGQLAGSLQGQAVTDPGLVPYAKRAEIEKMQDQYNLNLGLDEFKQKQQLQNDTALQLELAKMGIAPETAATSAPAPQEMNFVETAETQAARSPEMSDKYLSDAVNEVKTPMEQLAAASRQSLNAKLDQDNRKLQLEEEKFNLDKKQAQAKIDLDSRSAMKDTESKLTETQSGLIKTKEYIDNLESAINMAGETGGRLSPTIEDTARETKLMFQAAGGDATAQQRLAGRRLLKNSQIDAAGEVRKAFPGAVQAKEMELYMSTGGSTTNPRSVNEAILNKAKLAYQAAEQSHAFINELVKMGMPYSQAQKAYMDYDRKVPLFVTSKTGERSINPLRLGNPTGVPGSGEMPATTPTPQVMSGPTNSQAKMGLDEFLSWKRQQGF